MKINFNAYAPNFGMKVADIRENKFFKSELSEGELAKLQEMGQRIEEATDGDTQSGLAMFYKHNRGRYGLSVMSSKVRKYLEDINLKPVAKNEREARFAWGFDYTNHPLDLLKHEETIIDDLLWLQNMYLDRNETKLPGSYRRWLA